MAHNKFVVKSADTLQALLNELYLAQGEQSMTPRSLGITHTDSDFIAVLGYDEGGDKEMDYKIIEYGKDIYSDDENLETAINHDEQGLGNVICHAILMDGDNFVVVAMIESPE